MIITGIILIALQILAIASSLIGGNNPFQQGIAGTLGYFLIGFIGVVLIIIGCRRKNNTTLKNKNDSFVESEIKEVVFEDKNDIDDLENYKDTEDIVDIQSTYTQLIGNKLMDNKEKTITKNQAIKLCLKRNFKLSTNVTFASQNNSVSKCFWANPRFDYLNNDWTLILNDKDKRKLYLFLIPAQSISKEQLTPRSDNPMRIHLEIKYNDHNFTDRKSEFRFEKFKIGEIEY